MIDKTSSDWNYYGRDGSGGEITELYRMPADKASPMDKLAAKQRLRKGLFWMDAGDDPALGNDWISGWFDFEDNRLTEAQAAALIADWVARSDWPGRP